MKLEDLKVIDIIQMPQFEKHIEALIKDLYLTRTKIMNEHPGVQFKRGPIERLQEKKVFGPKALAALYAKVVDKTINASEYPSTLRTFIKGIGDEAFHRTYVELKQAEKGEKVETIMVKKEEGQKDNKITGIIIDHKDIIKDEQSNKRDNKEQSAETKQR